ncbi:hypothetical protein JW905_17035 [bacterium]|nr:hypothetical protein [candidate division CSSED10-310 bacterium]
MNVRMSNRIWCVAVGLSLAWSLWWFVFGLLSGAREAGGGIAGLLRNAPNALPGVLFVLIAVAALRYPMVCGFLLVAAGIGAMLLFRVLRWHDPVMLLTMLGLLVAPPVLAGILFIVTGGRRR